MQKFTSLVIAGALLALGILWAMQRQSLRDARDRLAALEAQTTTPSALAAAVTPAHDARPAPRSPASGADLAQRLSDLEQIVAQLVSATDSLMEHGHLALSTNKLGELQRRFLDLAASDKDRLHALRLLRRNKGFSDEVVQGALAWLQSSQDSAIRRDLVQHLDGATNAALRQPLLALAAGDADPRVRAEAVDNLRRLTGDRDVEARLWEIAQKDADPKVREQAQQALREGPMTPERAARLQQRAADAQASLDDRLLAMRALVHSGADVAGVTASLTQLAQNAQDPATRARVLRAFEGGQDPGMLSPLVGGLQDADPGVRKAAADSLSGFASDPRVRQWLEFVAQSDADTRVRREAVQALKGLHKPR